MKNKIIIFLLCTFILGVLCTSCEQNISAHGKENYVRLCANCHGENGEGLQGLIPPLAASDYLKNNKQILACIVKNGLNGEIEVNGKKYNQAMPALLANLSPADITNISNYVLNAWGNNYGELTLPEVEKQLEGCKRSNY
jgi:mono/diheme cytochrome c family protein